MPSSKKRSKKRPRRAFGAIRELPSGRFQARYLGPDNIQYKAPVTFDTYTDADTWLSGVRADITRGVWVNPSARKAATVPTFGEYAETWVSTRQLKPRTQHHYRYLLDKHILPTFGDLTITAITPAAIRAWHSTATKAATARAHAYALLKAVLATAVEDELIGSNPCRIRGASKTKRAREVHPATLDELVKLTEAMPARLRLLVQLSAWCALRFGEITELRRKDLDLKNGKLKVQRGVVRNEGQVLVDAPKTEAGIRTVAIPPHLTPMIKKHLRDHAQIGKDGLLFYSRAGGQLAHSSLLYHFNRASEEAGRPDLTPHALRHTGAVLAAQGGATIRELMARLGHTTPDMAMRYQHASEERDLVIAKRLSDLAGGA